MKDTTTLSCRNISDGDGYTYPVPSYIPSALLQDEDCEQEWKNKAGEFLSDGHHHANKTEHPLVRNETIKNIKVSECIELHHSVTCHGSSQKFIHTYQVINDTALSFEQQSNSTTTNTTIISVVVPLILIVVLIVGLQYIKRYNKKKRSRVKGSHINEEAQPDQAMELVSTQSTPRAYED
ncbi:uncharacterized protein LOC108272850 isoform X1 [Ictalurus punctatus]|uniref:Uncharacterized protein LOC108272850 isoform X1 n=1 Tax=Ictalurus punctatus TaxID=7998 RepID=A0A2D0S317_ICTPU|nr:uncharacterized protein LOC108272850 isoform X1 [Ictalurus punctatus]XP_047014860.1 uncharacterized protein LOC108272850 isoform X1 [Ictalurus punctatus]